jgi:hypothetical protein
MQVASTLSLSAQNFRCMLLAGCLCSASYGLGFLTACLLALSLYVIPVSPLVLALPAAHLVYVRKYDLGVVQHGTLRNY